MPFQPNNNANPSGRPVGAVGKSTADARAAIAAFVDANAERLNGLLDRIAKDDPKAAFDAIMAVCEYHIPKLARKEHVGDKDNPIEHRVIVQSDQDIIKRYENKTPEKT